jgi:hypothetical protein
MDCSYWLVFHPKYIAYLFLESFIFSLESLREYETFWKVSYSLLKFSYFSWKVQGPVNLQQNSQQVALAVLHTGRHTRLAGCSILTITKGFMQSPYTKTDMSQNPT